MNKTQKQRIRTLLLKHSKVMEKMLRKVLVKILRKNRRKIIDTFNRTQKSADFVEDMFQGAVTEVLNETTEVAGQEVMTTILATDQTFDLSAAASSYLDEESLSLCKTVSDSLKDDLRAALKEGYALGEGPDALARRMLTVLDDFQSWKMERIARTESIKAANNAALESYKQSGNVKEKEWVAASSETCPICVGLNGEVVLLKDNFSVGTDAPPAHPNCRCAIAPVV